jgi:hypothetical protein
MDTKFLTEWFGLGGAIFVVVFSLFKAIWPTIERQMTERNDLKRSDLTLRITEQDNMKHMVEAVKVTNELVAKNNEAFSRHNAIFDIHIQLIKELKEHQKGIRADLHRRFDAVEDKIESHHGNALLIGKGQDELISALRSMYGLGAHNGSTDRNDHDANQQGDKK